MMKFVLNAIKGISPVSPITDRLMPYHIQDPRSLDKEIARIATEQIERAIREIDDDALERPAAIHQVRKRCKKLRAVLRLLRGPLGDDELFSRENAVFRDAARSLSGLRDAEMLIHAYDSLMEHFAGQVDRRAYANVRRQLTLRRNDIVGRQQDPEAQLATAREILENALTRVPEWAERAGEFGSIEPGLRKTYHRGCRAMKAAYRKGHPDAFHEWRKRTKYHWYHCRLLKQLWRPVMRSRAEGISLLAKTLGNEHDLSVFRETVSEMKPVDDKTFDALLSLIDCRRDELRNEIRPLGECVFAEKTKHLARRFRAYWDARRG